MQEKKSLYKIYSRKRIKIFKPRKNNRKYNQQRTKIYTIVCILIIVSIAYTLINKSIKPIWEEICSDEAKSIATTVVNEQSTNVMKQHTYDEMFSIKKDEEGNIQMINANIFAIDEITSDIAIYIQEGLKNFGESNVKIPIGSFTGIKMLSGTGPAIKIKLSLTGEVNTELRTEFVEQGINQTLHRIYLQIDCSVNILTPFDTIKENISNQVLLAENVIIGHIPETYYNFEGENENTKLEVID